MLISLLIAPCQGAEGMGGDRDWPLFGHIGFQKRCCPYTLMMLVAPTVPLPCFLSLPQPLHSPQQMSTGGDVSENNQI